MESSEIARYKQQRQLAYARLDQIRKEVDDWLRHLEEVEPSLTQIALLEGLHAERARLLSDLQASENVFLDYLLRLRSEKVSDATQAQVVRLARRSKLPTADQGVVSC